MYPLEESDKHRADLYLRVGTGSGTISAGITLHTIVNEVPSVNFFLIRLTVSLIFLALGFLFFQYSYIIKHEIDEKKHKIKGPENG